MGLFTGLGTVAGGVGGAFLGGPMGAMAGASLGGGLGGMLEAPDAPELSQIKFSPDSLKSYNFDDISLARDNPELYAQLMKNSLLIDQANQILNTRRQGMSPEEQRTLRETKNNMTARLAAQGLIGDPVAEQALADSEAKIRERASAQAYQDKLGAMQMLAGLQQQQYGNLAQGQNAIMGANENNRNASLQRDLAMAGRDMQQFQDQVSQNQGRNQFYSGLLNGGLSMAGNAYNQSQMQDFQSAQAARSQANFEKMYGLYNAPAAPTALAPSAYRPSPRSPGGMGMLASNYSAPGNWGF